MASPEMYPSAPVGKTYEHGLFDPAKRKLAVCAASLVALVAPGVASASEQGPEIVDYDLVAEINLGPGETVVIDSDLDDNGVIKKVEKNRKFLEYERKNGTPGHWVKKQKEAGHCEMVGEGTDTPVYINSGRDVNGTLFTFKDDDRKKACLGKDGNWYLKHCDNRIWGPNAKTKHFIKEKSVTLVKSFDKKINGKVHEKATAKAECETDDAAAYAYGHGYAEASFNTRLGAVLKSKGVNVAVKASGKLHGKAKADAIANAQVACVEKPGGGGGEVCKPPTIDIKNPIQHVYPNGQVQITVETRDLDTPSDDLAKTISAPRGSLSDLIPKRDADGYVIPNTYIARYTADGTSGGTDTITATVSDGVDANCNPDLGVDDTSAITFDRPEDDF